jgi:hypothetical protein
LEWNTGKQTLHLVPRLELKLHQLNASLARLEGMISTQTSIADRVARLETQSAAIRAEFDENKKGSDKWHDVIKNVLFTLGGVFLAGAIGQALRTDAMVSKLEEKTRSIETTSTRISGDLKTTEEKFKNLNSALEIALKDLEKSNRDTKQVKYDFDVDALKQRVEATLSDLYLIDQLHYDGYGRFRDTIQSCLQQLRAIEANSPPTLQRRRYLDFVAGVDEFARSRPQTIDGIKAAHIINQLKAVPEAEHTCNYWYFLAAMEARTNQMADAMAAMDKAFDAAGGTMPLVSTRITYGRLYGDLLKSIDENTLERDQRRFRERFENLLGESPYYWPARVAYSTFLAHLKNKEGAFEQLAIAIDGGGASINNIVEMIRHDMTMTGESKYQLIPSLVPDPARWEDSLRADLTQRRTARRSRGLSSAPH